jgi:hypothetical protein
MAEYKELLKVGLALIKEGHLLVESEKMSADARAQRASVPQASDCV